MRLGRASPIWCTAAWLVAWLVACTTSDDGGERGTGWRDAGDEMPTDAAPADAAPPPPPVPNLDAILAGECATATERSRLLPSNMLFVLDRSGSMACNLPPTTDSPTCEANPVRVDADLPSKWDVVRAELVDAIALLPSTTVVGVSYFSNDDGCGVHASPSIPLLPLGEAQTAAIDASLGSVTPAGSTPLVGATVLAYKHLLDLSTVGAITGREFVVLITDGAQSETCSDPTRCDDAEACARLLVDTEVPKAASVGIGTFVIGAPGSEPARSTLSEIAVAGGTAPEGCDASRGACHFDMTREPDFGAALREALTDVVGRAIRCEFPVPRFDGESVDRERVNIVFTPSDGERRVIVHDDTVACDEGADGWQFADDDASIRICGASCEAVHGDPDARLDVVLGCPIAGPT